MTIGKRQAHDMVLNRVLQSALTLCTAVLISSCTEPLAEFDPGRPCDAGSFIVADTFEGSRRGLCEVYPDQAVRIHIQPEDEGPINNSAWYAFQVTAKEAKTIRVTLAYENGKHRYDPQLSRDGRTWTPLEPERYVHDITNRIQIACRK